MSILYSVIVPIYNTETYIRDCVDSVVSQTYTNWELILVDDGSTDASHAICDKLAQELGDRVCVIHQSNSGLLAARRAGFKAAKGDVFVSLDSDDTLRPDALEMIDEAFQSGDDIDVVAYAYSRHSDFSTIEGAVFGCTGHFTRADLVRISCVPPTLFSMCTKAVRRSAMDVDADYSPFFKLSFAEDLLQSLPIADNARGGYYIREPLYYYRTNPLSLSRKFDLRQLDARKVVHEVHLRYAKRWAEELGDPSLLSGVQTTGLKSYAEIAQGVCEVLPRVEAIRYLREFSSDPVFGEYYALPSCRDAVRGDRRLILAMLASGSYFGIWVMSKAKAILHNVTKR
ncbi:glycosyltransferase family 2 protein [Collinsella sp. SGI.033]|uniref:glycosyltransferase family 2 protein n=1 Tax=Collinsella sp. SGI.033 TaxID=3420552 RepID=UPI003D04956C